MKEPTFFSPKEIELAQTFFREGYVVAEIAAKDALQEIRSKVVETAREYLQISRSDPEQVLNLIHEVVSAEDLNQFRLDAIEKINADEFLRPLYFSLARPILESLVGNELAMQLRVNLSIQLPQDDKALLPVHADVWSGNSPFEVVVWLPLVDCFGTKTMFLLPPAPTQELHRRFNEYKEKSSEDLYQDIKSELKWIKISYGQVLLFNQNLPHGNRVNQECETRWSMNCRFKTVFSPYHDKKIGEYFEPITLRPASWLGMQYKYPGDKT